MKKVGSGFQGLLSGMGLGLWGLANYRAYNRECKNASP